mmetsp:Transcript_74895/g.236693  ORF Transcript_74895/g.236693 Transcript_74895/m.236693 type:complete len:308 (-) Transcript_74895:1299-2222(-)
MGHRAARAGGAAAPPLSAAARIRLAQAARHRPRGRLLGAAEGAGLGVGHGRGGLAQEPLRQLLLPGDALPGHLRLPRHGPHAGGPLLLHIRLLRRHGDCDHDPLALEGPGAGAAGGREGGEDREPEAGHVDGAALGHPAVHADDPHWGDPLGRVQHGLRHRDLLAALRRERPGDRHHVGLHLAADLLRDCPEGRRGVQRLRVCQRHPAMVLPDLQDRLPDRQAAQPDRRGLPPHVWRLHRRFEDALRVGGGARPHAAVRHADGHPGDRGGEDDQQRPRAGHQAGERHHGPPRGHDLHRHLRVDLPPA